jgi:hypothetical protein
VTIKVPSISPKIWFNINAGNTSIYTCTSSKISFMIELLKFSFSPIEDQVAEFFTKSLTEEFFSKIQSMLGVQEVVIKGG